jgi:hypothetical protein
MLVKLLVRKVPQVLLPQLLDQQARKVKPVHKVLLGHKVFRVPKVCKVKWAQQVHKVL